VVSLSNHDERRGATNAPRVGDGLSEAQHLHRSLTWKDAFWASSGVPAGVLLTIGGVASTIGQPSWLVFIASIMMGFIQSFTYAEIAGLYPHKSGGASVYGAAAWLPYSKFLAPISIWCNWIAWSPVLTLGCALAAGYVLTALFPPAAAINQWHFTIVRLDGLQTGLRLQLSARELLGTMFLLLTFALQHHGAASAARFQKWLGVVCLTPLVLVGLVPLLTGDLPQDHLLPLLPPGGAWNAVGLTALMGAMFTAGWSTYGFETAVCYTREFKNPAKDTARAIIAAGGLCILIFSLVPLAFQAHFGTKTLLAPDIIDGTGVALALAHIVGSGVLIVNLMVAMLILSLLLIVMTSMMGSSRTLYQASVDGWLPRYLARVNKHGAPTAAMWTDLGFNLILLLFSNYVFVLVVSNVCYLIFNWLNLQAGWIHRLDRPDWPRPFRCPRWLLATGSLFGFINMAFLGAGADTQGAHTFRNGLVAVALILPVFLFRHYWQDKGIFPAHMAEAEGAFQKRAGWRPWAALGLCAGVIAAAHGLARLS